MSEFFTDELSWKDTNLALFGSDEEKRVKKDAAMTEEAWIPVMHVREPQLFVWRIEVKDAAMTEEAWIPVMHVREPQLFVWRIEKFRLTPINPNDYGQFFNGDSYIVLNVYERNNKLNYDVHFWIGRSSTQDEYGTAAYKTVELDTLLDGICVQHREVEGYESNLFKSYFPNLRILNGGIESGFRHVTPNQYQPRLLHFRLQDKKLVVMQEVDLSANSLKSDDVFILDLGSSAYQWRRTLTSNKEKNVYAAAKFISELQHERLGKCKGHVLDEDNVEDNDIFLRVLPNVPIKRSLTYLDRTKCVYRLSDESGDLKFELIATNSAPEKLLHKDDVYFIDTGSQLFIYIASSIRSYGRKTKCPVVRSPIFTTDYSSIRACNCVLRASVIVHSQELEEVWDPDRSKCYLED
ncbi:Severin [Fasciola gigantica]|uniref:Severin n=1 Tax=Fasciola gigantica TaxID=46835 RepID=A0A504YFI9_FASGI|nr:Severin [Fasciola gigantica]